MQDFLAPFDERELELIIGGLGKIDVEDWKANTRLKVSNHKLLRRVIVADTHPQDKKSSLLIWSYILYVIW